MVTTGGLARRALSQQRVRTWNPAKRALLAPLAAAVLVLALGSPAAAASPQGLTLVSTTIFNPSGPNYGTFVASGPAVDNGVICGSGTFVDTGVHFAGYESNKAIQIQVFKTYTCSGGDSFYIKMQIHANFDGTEVFTWVVQGGTGAYVNLHGTGNGTTAPTDTGNINTFVGAIQ